jgi:hypothetical protein
MIMKIRRLSFLLVMTMFFLFGCQIVTSAPLPGPADPTSAPPVATERRPAPEAIPGLAGTWQYFSESGTLYYNIDIVWDGQVYYVENCVGFNDVICEIESQSWDGVMLAWTNYFPNTDYTTAHTVVAVVGDVLTTTREGTGGVGTTLYQRAP